MLFHVIIVHVLKFNQFCWMSFGVTQLLGSYRVESAICVAQFAEKLGVRESCAAATNVACVAHKKLANRCWRRIAPLH